MTSKFYFDARNVPAILVAGGLLLALLGFGVDSVSNGEGNGEIAFGAILIVIGILLYVAKEYSR